MNRFFARLEKKNTVPTVDPRLIERVQKWAASVDIKVHNFRWVSEYRTSFWAEEDGNPDGWSGKMSVTGNTITDTKTGDHWTLPQ